MKIFESLNDEGIPKFFWWTISFCLIALTVGLLFIVDKSQSVSIEIANAKIQTISNITKIDDAYEQLKKANDKLEENNKELQNKINEFNKATTKPIPIAVPLLKRETINPDLEKSISNLKNIRSEIQQQQRN